MNSRFYFKQYQVIPPGKEGDKPTVEEVEDSINLFDIHRTRTYKDGGMVVLLKDGHEVDQVEPVVSTNKNGAKTLVKKRVWVQSEVRLSPADAARLKKITDVAAHYGNYLSDARVMGSTEAEAEVRDTIETDIPPEGEPAENILENSN